METIRSLFISPPFSQDSALPSAGILEHPDVAGIILLIYAFLGLTWYFLAFWSQRRHLKVFQEAIYLSISQQRSRLRGVQNIHSSLFTMLLMDIASGITSVIMAIELFSSFSGGSHIDVFWIWYQFRLNGLVLHFLNAFVCLLFLCHPDWASKLRLVSVGVVLLICVFIPFHIYLKQVTIFGMGGIILGLALAIIVKYIASSASPSPAANRKTPVVIVAMLTFTVVFAPSFILECLITTAQHVDQLNDYLIIYLNILFCTNLHLPMDGLLCFFILKLSSEEEELQQQQQPQQQQQQQPSFGNANYDGSANAIS